MELTFNKNIIPRRIKVPLLVMQDWEDRVIELKREVNELLDRGGQPPPYPRG